MKAILTLFFMAFLLYGSAPEGLKEEVKSLKLGMDGYILGESLSPTQVEKLNENPLRTNTPRIAKFKDGDLNIIVDDKDKTVLVLYKNFENVSRERLKSSIGELMLSFNEPTTMTHSKMLYWFYGAKGKLDRSDLDLLKERKSKKRSLASFVEETNIAPSKPIATLKLSSNQNIIGSDSKEDMQKSADSEIQALNYYIILSSEKMLKNYMP